MEKIVEKALDDKDDVNTVDRNLVLDLLTAQLSKESRGLIVRVDTQYSDVDVNQFVSDLFFVLFDGQHFTEINDKGHDLAFGVELQDLL